ncbi:MarR family protein [Amycolatopsis sacchari]|uniref:MarR family protein n=2 Tax=Amycolatopsis sacchari TaxID=115433 RepID=A0A1I3V336_9PSEU|nr:MarR family protein [Amycolatopsis sacchari]
MREDGSMPTDDPAPLAEGAVRFAEKFGQMLTDAGMPRMPSRVFAMTLASPEGHLTAAELGAALKISPAAVSGAVRYLVQIGLLRRERPAGERRDQFVVHSDYWFEVYSHQDKLYRTLLKTLAEGIDAVGAGTRAGARLQETHDFFAFMAEEMPKLVERWRAGRASGAGA